MKIFSLQIEPERFLGIEAPTYYEFAFTDWDEFYWKSQSFQSSMNFGILPSANHISDTDMVLAVGT